MPRRKIETAQWAADLGLSEAWLGDLVARLRARFARVHRRACQSADDGRAPLDLLAWGRRYLSRYFTKPASLMHRWLGERLDALRGQRGVKLNAIGPRGGAKSTIGSLAYPLQAAVEGREPYIWIVSDTKQQAAAHLENIKQELLDNPLLAADYPDAVGRGPVWRQQHVVLANGVMIEACGTGQRLRGRRRREHRPTLIVCDDLQNDRHAESAEQRRHSREWFHAMLLKAGTKTTNILNLATALHHDALALELIRTPGWDSRVFRALERWPERMDLWEAWEAIYADTTRDEHQAAARAFYAQHQAEMDAGAELLWPEEEDLYTLFTMRAESGRTAFEREKQGSPLNPAECEWPADYFERPIWFDDWPSDAIVRTLSLDPSKGRDARRGDYSAYVLLAIDPRGVVYVEADLARRPTPQMVADGATLAAAFRPDAFGVEANQFQELLAGEFAAEFSRRGLTDCRVWAIHNHVAKAVRIRRLGPYLAAGKLRFKAHSPGTRLLVDQLREFPLADHDDGPDAAEMALRLALEHLATNSTGDASRERIAVG